MKAGWGIKKLNEVCQVRPPKKEAKDSLNENDFVSFVPMKSLGISQKYFDAVDDKLLLDVSGSYTYFRNNDVLLAKITPCFENGKLGIARNLTNEIGFGSSEFIVYRVLNSLNNEFLYYFLSRESFREIGKSKMTGAVGHKRIPKDFYELTEIPIPSLKEQKQIVAILDQAFAAIDQAQANIQQNIQNAQDLFQSKLNQIFSQQGEGWEERQLNKICDVKDGTHSSPKYIDEGDGIPFVTQKNILNSGISFENTKFINQTDHDDFYRRSNVSYGDILFSMIGANRGMACIVDDARIFSIKNVGLIKASDEYSAKYLLYFLKSPIAKKFVADNSSGSAQGFIGLTKLRKFPIPFTGIKKQRVIEQELEILNDFSLKIENKYAEKLNCLEELKKSLLQKAFSGELTKDKQAA